jgi:hypothetical protein
MDKVPKIPGLLDGDVITLYPALATRAGINQALILQQLHFLIQITRKATGRWWVFNSYAEWQDYFPWLSTSSIRRLFRELETDGIILSWPTPNQDQKKNYTIHYEIWEAWFSRPDPVQNEQGQHDPAQNEHPTLSKMNTVEEKHPVQNEHSTVSKLDRVGVQNEHGRADLSLYIDSETTQRLPTEIKALAPPPLAASAGAPSTPVQEIADTPKPKRAPRKRTDGTDPVPAVLMTPMKNALAAAFGWSWDGDTPMTPQESGLIQKAARSLCQAKFPPADVLNLYAYCKARFDDFGPMALATNVSAFRQNGGNHADPARRTSDHPKPPQRASASPPINRRGPDGLLPYQRPGGLGYKQYIESPKGQAWLAKRQQQERERSGGESDPPAQARPGV